IKAGAVPEHDAYIVDDVKVAVGKQGNLLKVIDNWELLLAEVNPLVASGKVKPEQVSWGALKGHALVWGNRVHGIMYNTKLISKTDVPQAYVDITNPKYKERYVVAPFPTMWLYGALIHPKDKWLKVMEGIGKNAAAVLTFQAGSERVNLGEFAFQPLATQDYFRIRSRDPQAPVAVQWPTDIVQNTIMTYVVSAKAKHPSAGALWALWMTTPEAQKLWQPEIVYPNIMYGESAFDLEVRSALGELKKKGAKVVSWFDNRETEAMLQWYGTKEGLDYRKRIENALTQRK
ncbi:MAG: extracellular solute-binding protein, partial [Deltaproteobacteria bacterium]|nr:extracellular solute-binding protein [Deltaproteobacteria bacterium]